MSGLLECLISFVQYQVTCKSVCVCMYVRQKLREVERLLLQARKDTPLRKMEDFIDPSKILHTVTAVKKISGYDEEKCTFQTPSLAMKLGHSLQKIASLVSFQAMVDGDSEKAQKARNFTEMYQSRWNELVSANALKTLREDKWNAPQVLPFTEDVKKIHLYLDKKQDESYRSLSTESSSKNWTSLAKRANLSLRSFFLIEEDRVKFQRCLYLHLSLKTQRICMKTLLWHFQSLKKNCAITSLVLK